MDAKLASIQEKYDELSEAISQPEVIQDFPRYQACLKERAALEPIVGKYQTLLATRAHLEEARELVNLANEKGLYLGVAPDTVLGAGIQTARRALDTGMIGQVSSGVVTINRNQSLNAELFGYQRCESFDEASAAYAKYIRQCRCGEKYGKSQR